MDAEGQHLASDTKALGGPCCGLCAAASPGSGSPPSLPVVKQNAKADRHGRHYLPYDAQAWAQAPTTSPRPVSMERFTAQPEAASALRSRERQAPDAVHPGSVLSWPGGLVRCT